MPSSTVSSIPDPIEDIKARVDASLAKMDVANGLTQRTWRPQSALMTPPKPPRRPPPSRPSTACSSALASRRSTVPRAPGGTASASRELLAYARQRFDSAVACEDRLAMQASESLQNALRSEADSASGFSAASQHSHVTSKTLVSAYVTLTSTGASSRSSVTAVSSAQKEQHEQRARLMNEIRVRGKKQRVRMQHDRVAQELCQEGALPSKTSVSAFKWPEFFYWGVEPRPRLDHERKAAQERLEKRLLVATDVVEGEKGEEEKKNSAPQEAKNKR